LFRAARETMFANYRNSLYISEEAIMSMRQLVYSSLDADVKIREKMSE
jgi:hypothetical protein